MIRYALIALGLMASGVGASAANALGRDVANSACGAPQVAIHSQDDLAEPEVVQQVDGHGDLLAVIGSPEINPADMDVPMAVLLVASLQGDAMLFDLVQGGAIPVDGSDPSADFCP